ncbi:hypothetical protein LTR53_013892 [Teratosphaeriaceae sp. CCFEE 6253]|nr:hypothetical protein LTR53_013892 [Teratosphaeriaceae sp. CCFEE 6253]
MAATPMYPNLYTQLSAFLQHAQASGTLGHPPSLTNPLHPIFHPDHFSPGNIDLDLFAPVARLVSRILATPPVRHYFFVIFFGANEPAGVQGAQGEDLETIWSDRLVGALSPADEAALDEVLAYFSTMVRFLITDFGGQEVDGETIPDSSALAPPRDLWPNRHISPHPGSLAGIGSTICLAHDLYDHLLLPIGGLRTPQAHLNDCFRLALLILHELAHAANLAVMGAQRPEDFFLGAPVAEAGFEIQARFLGASVDSLGAHADAPMQLWEWPHNSVLSDYAGELGCQRRVCFPPQDRVMKWEMPAEFLQAVWYDGFWDWAREVGPAAYVPEVVARSIWRALETRDRMPVPSSVADAFRSVKEPVVGPGGPPFPRVLRVPHFLRVWRSFVMGYGSQGSGAGA